MISFESPDFLVSVELVLSLPFLSFFYSSFFGDSFEFELGSTGGSFKFELVMGTETMTFYESICIEQEGSTWDLEGS